MNDLKLLVFPNTNCGPMCNVFAVIFHEHICVFHLKDHSATTHVRIFVKLWWVFLFGTKCPKVCSELEDEKNLRSVLKNYIFFHSDT